MRKCVCVCVCVCVCGHPLASIRSAAPQVLIAINPFERVDIYGDEVINKYRDAASDVKRRLRTELPPHVFTVSQTSHFQLLKTNQNQVRGGGWRRGQRAGKKTSEGGQSGD